VSLLAAIFEPDLAFICFLAAVIVGIVSAVLLKPSMGMVLLAVSVALIALGLLCLTPEG
jgi:O-antigen/teichoic acid export membrane protein